MLRNKSKKDPALLAVRLSILDKTSLEIFYHYYDHLTTDGLVGFNNNNAGSIKHKQKCSHFNHLSENTFRLQGKSMSMLAKEYFKAGKSKG
jgi:sucrose-6-phosphate hydrolase SacC (GH32 family)